MKISDLTSGEKLLIVRRRRGLTQAEMGQLYDLSRTTYRAMENDLDYIPGGESIPRVSLERKFALYEIALIKRRRSGYSQGETAVRMGISKYWLRRMETDTAPTDRLLEYWNLA